MNIGYSDYKVDSIGGLGIIGDVVISTVLVETAARDGGTAGGGASTNLKPGVVLGQLSANEKYTDFDQDGADGSQLEADCVILAEEIADISTGDQLAAVIVACNGSIDWDRLRWATADDKSAFARADSPFHFHNVN